ncbi:MAG TPA: AlpA family phage regulatory protein [Pseudomonas sp.]|nr:AlpA family phage regulatory protein [Pseudomonas sp.]
MRAFSCPTESATNHTDDFVRAEGKKRGEFPQYFMLTPRCAVWFEAEVDAWLYQRMVNPASPAQPSPARAPDVSLRKSSRGRAASIRPAAPGLTPAWERRKMVFRVSQNSRIESTACVLIAES